MAEYQHIGHAKYDIKYHIVWITKYRYKILTTEIGKRLKELLIQGCRSRGITIRKGHIDEDHVHLLLSCPPELSVSKIVQYLKGRSSHLLQDEYPQLKKRYWGQHLWGRGYFCVTVGAMTEDMIKAYIEAHQEEDKEITVHDEFQS
jgi:putative transposase